MSEGFENMSARFFIWDPESDGEGDFVECGEVAFEAATGTIEYERHSVWANGVRQICLTKNPFTS